MSRLGELRLISTRPVARREGVDAGERPFTGGSCGGLVAALTFAPFNVQSTHMTRPSGKGYFITGISTEVGKTVTSAALVEAWQADYWKPVQAGDLDHGDTDKVKNWVSNTRSTFHPERYRLQTPMSPDAAAAREGVRMRLTDFTLPPTDNLLLVEGAGGIYVPLNSEHTMLDLMTHLKLSVILVSRHYLGSINHTLLSIAVLRQAGLSLAGLVYSGKPHPETERSITEQSGVRPLGRVPEMNGGRPRFVPEPPDAM